MKPFLKFLGAACAVLVAAFLLIGATVEQSARTFVATGATNLAVLNGVGSLICGTGLVTMPGAVGPQKFTNFSSAVQTGNVGTVSNIWIVVTNEGLYRISFGAAMTASAGDTMAFQVWTNGPGITPAHCNLISMNATMAASPVFETGFKMFNIQLPAGCHLFIQTTNSAAAAVTLRNICFNIGSAL